MCRLIATMNPAFLRAAGTYRSPPLIPDPCVSKRCQVAYREVHRRHVVIGCEGGVEVFDVPVDERQGKSATAEILVMTDIGSAVGMQAGNE